jgi:serine/threonine protein kinase
MTPSANIHGVFQHASLSKPPKLNFHDLHHPLTQHSLYPPTRQPTPLSNYIFQFNEDFHITEMKMNKLHRKVYAGFQREDNLEIVIILVHHKECHHVPKEVVILRKLQGLGRVCQCLGWCFINYYTYALLFKYYIECDPIKTIRENMGLIQVYIQDLLTALAHVHASNIAHRDVAIENILWNPVLQRAILTDFDAAEVIVSGNGYHSKVGRPGYDAPEKVQAMRSDKREGYDHRADVYSVGVILWMLLNQEQTPPPPTQLRIWLRKSKLRNSHIEYHEIALLLKLLEEDPAKRITAEEALTHPFCVSPSYREQAHNSRVQMYHYICSLAPPLPD